VKTAREALQPHPYVTFHELTMLLGVGGWSRWSHGCKTKRITSKLALWGVRIH